MRHIGEVLRLAAQGLSYHEISRSVGISRTSVHNYLERAQRAGLRWPLPGILVQIHSAAAGSAHAVFARGYASHCTATAARVPSQSPPGATPRDQRGWPR
jgi:hypothetical protein